MCSTSKIICLAGFLAFTCITAISMPVPKEEKPEIPPDLYLEFKPVPVEENAIINWRRAAELVVVASNGQKQLMKYCWTPDARTPSEDELDGLRAWLKQNEQALQLFDASLKKPKAQWPERNPQNVQPEIKSFSMLIRARLLEADMLAQEKQFAAAFQKLDDNLKLAEMAAGGDAYLIHYLLACNARSLTQDAMLRMARQKAMPLPLLYNMLTNLPSLNSETNLYDHILRAEFMQGYEHSIDVKKLADDWSRMSATNAELMASLYPDELHRAFRVLLDPSLVAQHPKPYDAGAEITRSIRNYRIYRANTLVPWTERDGEVELDHEIEYTNFVQDIEPLMQLTKNDALPLSKQAAERARAAYITIENPIGRIMDTSVTEFVASDLKVCQTRTAREATRACLATMIFERRHGRLPATLEAVVEEKILSALPMDLFCGKPLCYSRNRRIIWSVSDDGVDDNGESGKGRWYDKDAVWHIPEIK